jgi:signal peptidase II
MALGKKWRLSYLAIAASIIALDRLTKAAIVSEMPLHTTKNIIPGFFDLVHARNTGIAFSMFADASPFIKSFLIPLFSASAVVMVLVLLWKSEPAARQFHYALVLILSGAAGNLYDRAVYGYVTDFLDVFIGTYHWPAFNVADSAITIGAGLLLLDAARTTAEEPETQSSS